MVGSISVNLRGSHFGLTLSTESKRNENHRVIIYIPKVIIPCSQVEISFPEDPKSKWFRDDLHDIFHKHLKNANEDTLHSWAVYTIRNAISPSSFADEKINPFVVSKYIHELTGFFQDSFYKYFGTAPQHVNDVEETFDYFTNRVMKVLLKDYEFTDEQKNFITNRIAQLRDSFNNYKSYASRSTTKKTSRKQTDLTKFLKKP